MKRNHISGCLILFFIFLLVMRLGANTIENRKMVLEPTFRTARLLKLLPSSIDPSFVAPVLLPEPEYTWGLANTIYWDGSSMQVLFDSQNLDSVFYEVQAIYDSMELWGYVDGDQDSARFINLPEGISISYRLRYFAVDTTGEYGMSYWSEPEVSIQDFQPPILEIWDIVHLQETEDINWVIGSTIQNHVVAYDSTFGKIMSIVIQERSNELADDTLFYDLEPPVMYADTTIPYTIRSPQKEPVMLSLWVVDVAGQASEKETLTIFWWPYEGEEGKMVCFPNPFNPNRGESSIIKQDTPGVTRVRVFDLFGNLIRVLDKEPDESFFEWDGRNERGDIVSNGGYLCVVDGRTDLYCKIAVLK